MPDLPQKREAALAFLKEHRLGSLATISKDGAPRVRSVYYACNDSFEISFITLASTRKVEDLGANTRAAFSVATENVPRTLQIEGVVEDLTEAATIDAMVSELTKHWLSNTSYGAPLTRLDPGVIRYYRLTPSWVRWGDFTSGSGTDEVLSEIPLS